MKYKSIFIMAVLSLSLMSCSSTKINDTKVSAADSVGKAVEKELGEEYATIVVAGKDCAAEAKMEGQKARDQIFDLLKAHETVQASALQAKSLSSAGGIVQVACNFVISSVLPPLIKSESSDYACLRALTADKVAKVGDDLCTALDI